MVLVGLDVVSFSETQSRPVLPSFTGFYLFVLGLLWYPIYIDLLWYSNGVGRIGRSLF